MILDLNAFSNNLIIISAPSGVGKTTLWNSLKTKLPFSMNRVITVTTREPRISEKQGVDYYFVDKWRFETYIQKDLFLEYAEVHGNFYGTPLLPITKALNEGRDSILIVDVQGVKTIKEKVNGCVCIFLLPPSWKELEERLRSRNSEREEDIQLRLDNARKEVTLWDMYDYHIVAESLEPTISAVESIIAVEKLKKQRNNALKVLGVL